MDSTFYTNGYKLSRAIYTAGGNLCKESLTYQYSLFGHKYVKVQEVSPNIYLKMKGWSIWLDLFYTNYKEKEMLITLS